MNREDKKELKRLKRDEAYHRKLMEYHQEAIKILKEKEIKRT